MRRGSGCPTRNGMSPLHDTCCGARAGPRDPTTWSAPDLKASLARLFPSSPVAFPKTSQIIKFEADLPGLREKARGATGRERLAALRDLREHSQAALQDFQVRWLQTASSPTRIRARCTSRAICRSRSPRSTSIPRLDSTPKPAPGAMTRGVRLLEEMMAGAGSGHDNGNEGFLKHTMMDALVTEKKVQRVLSAYRPDVVYPTTTFSNSLRNVAALVSAGLSTRVYFVSLSGFDTHSNQPRHHANLLRSLSEGLAAFQRDLRAHRLDQQVTTMTFSEFGRRPSENDSHGTDHGTSAPLFVMGSRVNGGIHGAAPSLRLARNQDLSFTTDFRQVYATMLDRWLGCPSTSVLGRSFSPLPVIA
jgi:hypothetical protein